MYIDSINKNNTDYTLSSFGNIIVCSNAIDDVKTVTFPNGFVNTDPEPYLAFQVLFVNGHNCVNSTTYMTLNGYDVMVNKDGTLINLPIHEFTENNTSVYKSLQANTILNLFFDGTRFVVIGNPLVLSSTDYEIYANGQNDKDVYSTSEVKTNKVAPDGRPIYRKCYICTEDIKLSSGLGSVPGWTDNIRADNYDPKNIISSSTGNNCNYVSFYPMWNKDSANGLVMHSSIGYFYKGSIATIEYVKDSDL